jgi:hypothetical protein
MFLNEEKKVFNSKKNFFEVLNFSGESGSAKFYAGLKICSILWQIKFAVNIFTSRFIKPRKGNPDEK